jgi:hypothetical protein
MKTARDDVVKILVGGGVFRKGAHLATTWAAQADKPPPVKGAMKEGVPEHSTVLPSFRDVRAWLRNPQFAAAG